MRGGCFDQFCCTSIWLSVLNFVPGSFCSAMLSKTAPSSSMRPSDVLRSSPPPPPFLDRGWVLLLAMCNSVESHASDLVIRSSSKPSSSRNRRTVMTDFGPLQRAWETRADLGASQYPHGAPSGCSPIHVGVHIRLLALLFIQRSSLSAKSPGASAFRVCHRHVRHANKIPEA